jgi:hypothetical protein
VVGPRCSARCRWSEGSVLVWLCSADIGCSQCAGAARVGVSVWSSGDRPEGVRESLRPTGRVRDRRIVREGTVQGALHEIWNIDWVEHDSSLAVLDGEGVWSSCG